MPQSWQPGALTWSVAASMMVALVLMRAALPLSTRSTRLGITMKSPDSKGGNAEKLHNPLGASAQL